jgi:hypothetical protein
MFERRVARFGRRARNPTLRMQLRSRGDFEFREALRRGFIGRSCFSRSGQWTLGTCFQNALSMGVEESIAVDPCEEKSI